MAYDPILAGRVRELLAPRPGFAEREMFGGLCFLLGGHMCCGVVKDELMVRVGADAHAHALSRPHARPMDFTGRPLRGMVYVARPALRTARGLAAWVERGAAFAGSLPPRTGRRRAAKKGARKPARTKRAR